MFKRTIGAQYDTMDPQQTFFRGLIAFILDVDAGKI